MFDFFSWSHVLILLTAALVIVGPKDLPRLMHMAGKWAGKGRAMANEFRRSFDEMARQSELDELRKEIEALKKPMTDAQADLDNSIAEMDRAVATGEPAAGMAEAAAEPRSGEFLVTETAPPEAPAPAQAPNDRPVP